MTCGSTILRVEALAKAFGSTIAIAEVSFAISTGEVVALTGGNGSGKSTLLKIIAGAISPDAGLMSWGGQALAAGNPHKTRLEGIEMVFQDLALCPECSVLENLFLGREQVSKLGFLQRKNMKRLAEDMIKRYELPIPSLNVTPMQLSGGQQKAVAIGRALLTKPRLLLLDEPTAGLGVKEQQTILRTLGELRTGGVAIIICTHSPDEVLSTADRVLILRRGELVFDGSLTNMSRADLAVLMST
jgi:simple sugar transport system ATP-binding protein